MSGAHGIVVSLVVGGVLLADAQPREIVRRHDRPDAAYLELGAAFPAVAKLGGRMGDGTLVAPAWILTAAHIADGMLRRGSRSVMFQGQEHVAQEFFIHPDWTQMGPHDFALIRLAEPVVGIEPLPLYDKRDERGRVATLVGHGRDGDGHTGPTGDDGRRRGATNRIESADDRYLAFRFDEGDEATELEGTPAGGDSGGPAVIEVDGRRYVAGVSSLGRPGRNGPATCGAEDHFGRVSTHLTWLRAAMTGRATPTTAPSTGGPERTMVRRPGGSARDTVIRALVMALQSGSDQALDTLVREQFAPAMQAPSRRDTLRTTLRDVARVVQAGDDLDLRMRGGAAAGVDIHVLKAGATLGVVELTLSDEPTPKIIAIALRSRAAGWP